MLQEFKKRKLEEFQETNIYQKLGNTDKYEQLDFLSEAEYFISNLIDEVEKAIPKSYKCHKCGKIIDNNDANWEGRLWCEKCNKDCGDWSYIGFNKCIKKFINNINKNYQY